LFIRNQFKSFLAITDFPLWSRRLFLVLLDSISIFISLNLSLSLRPLTFKYTFLGIYPIYLLFIFSGLIIYIFTGHYKGLTRFIGSTEFYKLFLRNFAYLIVIVSITYSIDIINKDVYTFLFWSIFYIYLTLSTSIIRLFIRDIIFYLLRNKFSETKNVAIYGAGICGANLLQSLRNSTKYNVVLLVDDDPLLWKRSINGLIIRPPESITSSKYLISSVFLASSTFSKNRIREIVKSLSGQNINVFKIPSYDELISGSKSIDALRKIKIEDLLGRQAVSPDINLLGPGINGKNILVTGAAGSIGSQLCKEISKHQPNRLLMLDNNEKGLYEINKYFQNLSTSIEVLPILGSSTDFELLVKSFNRYSVDLVFHSAAYKHVPLVEINPIQGIFNNIFSTYRICKAVLKSPVTKIVLISSDKAVRPTNIMGATKRVSEVIFQDFANHSENKIFTMVRFGNVIGSSGSVVPLFNEQIDFGGPITLTDRRIIRYFMTVNEAVQLVLQAAYMAQGGDIFLLDMGEQVSIYELAKQMIYLKGLTVKDSNNPNGDIEIKEIGLRSGEKLYEELLVGNNSINTVHPLIYKTFEEKFDSSELLKNLTNLEKSVSKYKLEDSLSIMSNLVPEWKPSSRIYEA